MAMVPMVRPIELKPMSLKMIKRARMMQQQQQQQHLHISASAIDVKYPINKTHSWNPYTMSEFPTAAFRQNPAGFGMLGGHGVARGPGKSLEDLRF
jgi:hypothetical protein